LIAFFRRLELKNVDVVVGVNDVGIESNVLSGGEEGGGEERRGGKGAARRWDP